MKIFYFLLFCIGLAIVMFISSLTVDKYSCAARVYTNGVLTDKTFINVESSVIGFSFRYINDESSGFLHDSVLDAQPVEINKEGTSIRTMIDKNIAFAHQSDKRFLLGPCNKH